MLETVNIERHGFFISIQNNNLRAYADDVAIKCLTSSGLRKLSQVFSQEANEHGLIISFEKTKVLMFGRQDGFQYELDNQIVEVSLKVSCFISGNFRI